MKTVEEVLAAFELAMIEEKLSRNTRRTYSNTVAEFAGMMKRGEITGLQDYFDHLGGVKKLAANSVRHALNPLKFLYERVLDKEFPTNLKLPKRNKNRRMPSVLSHADIINLLCEMDRIERLQAGLLYGSGLRVESDMLKIRLKDVNTTHGTLMIQEGKGDKSRAVILPRALVGDLERQILACRKQWEKDRSAGIICPHESESLMRKYGRRTFGTLPWYWLFPSRTVHQTAAGGERWHATDKRLTTALKEGAERLGILQRVHPHVLRKSYATNLLRDGVDIRTIQDQLGHADVKTTEIYAIAAGLRGTPSPLDRLTVQRVSALEQNITPFRKLA